MIHIIMIETKKQYDSFISETVNRSVPEISLGPVFFKLTLLLAYVNPKGNITCSKYYEQKS